MKKKIRKIILITIGTILAALTIFIATLFITGKIYIEIEDGRPWLVIDETDGEGDSYSQTIKASKTTYPTDIFVYGEDCNFRKEVEFAEITRLCDEQLESDKKYRVIIINDLSEIVELTQEDLELLHRYAYEERYIVIYIGMKQYQKLVDNDICVPISDLGNVDGFAIRFVGDTPIYTSGIWGDEGNGYYNNGNKEILGESIFMFLRSIYMES